MSTKLEEVREFVIIMVFYSFRLIDFCVFFIVSDIDKIQMIIFMKYATAI